MDPIALIPDAKNKEAFGIVENAVRKLKKESPLVIGITGAGGAGKTTFGNNLVRYYGEKNCVSIDLDDYLISRDERGKLELTGYDPRANKLSDERRDIEDLICRKTISKPRYDHSTGKILQNETITPRELVIIEGVTTLYEELRELNDISFFMDAMEETQIKSRIERDVKTRGYTYEEAMILFETLKPSYKRFIEPTKKFASVIVRVSPDYVMHPLHISKKLKQ